MTGTTKWTQQEIHFVADRAYSLYLQGRTSEAQTMFEGLLEVEPSNRYCHMALALLKLGRGEAKDAIDHLSKILDRSPYDVEARARRCEAFLELERTEDAEQDWKQLDFFSDAPLVKRLKVRMESARKPGPGRDPAFRSNSVSSTPPPTPS